MITIKNFLENSKGNKNGSLSQKFTDNSNPESINAEEQKDPEVLDDS